MVELFLRYPVSANSYWRYFNGRVVVTSEAKDYKAHVAERARAIGTPVFEGDVKIWVTLHPKTKADGSQSKRVLDIDNCLKVTLDALQGPVLQNDNQIKAISASYGEARPDGGLRVVIAEYGG